MSTRQALVVDDSRSARHVLGRMLEGFGLQVQAVESAEDALTYLQGARPDVIFMDHLMPGMDGFAAVRLIKANPKTATIPVVMYTSQEGEMYLSQARALGAVGVVPKTLKSADVATVLQQLHLQSSDAAMAARAPESSARPATPTAAAVEVVRVSTDEQPVDNVGMTHAPTQAMPSTQDRLAHRIAAEIRAELAAFAAPPPPPTRPYLVMLPLLLLVTALAIAALFQVNDLKSELQQLKAAQQETLTTLQALRSGQVTQNDAALFSTEAPTTIAAIAAPLSTPATAAPHAQRTESEPYLYGEVPFSGPRVEHLRRLLDSLRSEGFRGTVRVTAYSGDFCLSGSPGDGYQMAMDDLLVKRCEIVGNPFADNLSVQQRQSVAFANLLASTLRSGIQVDVMDGGRTAAVPYPPQSDKLTAGEWNRVAERNQRIEFNAFAAP